MAWDADKMTGVLAPDFVWDAGEVMNSKGRGTVYTWIEDALNPARIEFKVESILPLPLCQPIKRGHQSRFSL